MFAVANLRKNQFYCPACKNTTGIVQVFLPYACKLLFQVSAASNSSHLMLRIPVCTTTSDVAQQIPCVMTLFEWRRSLWQWQLRQGCSLSPSTQLQPQSSDFVHR